MMKYKHKVPKIIKFLNLQIINLLLAFLVTILVLVSLLYIFKWWIFNYWFVIPTLLFIILQIINFIIAIIIIFIKEIKHRNEIISKFNTIKHYEFYFLFLRIHNLITIFLVTLSNIFVLIFAISYIKLNIVNATLIVILSSLSILTSFTTFFIIQWKFK